MANMLKYFDGYVKFGFKPIAIYKNAKCPIGRDWNKNWSISQWRPFFEDPSEEFNMGILLGDIIDVEGDTLEANLLLNKLIGDTPHPKFSSSKSTHHLFATPDPNLTRFAFNGLEFRGKNHQSVVPPSKHNDGASYRWLQDSKFTILPMPSALLEYFHQNRKSRGNPRVQNNVKPKNKQGHVKTKCKACLESFYIHKKRLILEVRAFQEHKLPWMCRGCRKIDVREECRFLRNILD